MNEKNMNYLSLNDCIWCDICKKTMRKSIKSKSENEIVNDEENEREKEKYEMNVKSYENEMNIKKSRNEIWSESTIDELKENMIVVDQEKRW